MGREVHTLPSPEEAADIYLEESGLGFYSREDKPVKVCAQRQENPRFHRPTYKLSIDASNQGRISLPQETEEKKVEANGRIWYRDTLEDPHFDSLNYVVYIDLPGFED